LNGTPTDRTVPAAHGHWLLGLARNLSEAPHMLPAQLGWRHGGLARFRVLHRPFLAVTDSAVAREMLHSDLFVRSFHYKSYQALLGRSLIAAEGPHWARRRRMVLPAFRTGHLDRFTRVMRDCTLDMLDRWESERLAGRPIDAMEEGHRITLAVMGMALMSAPVDTQDADRFAEAIRKTLFLVRRRNTSMFRLPLWLPSPANTQLRRTRGELDGYVGTYISARLQETDNDRRDLLDDLRAARAADTGEPMTYSELLEETKGLFVTGYETTAVSLAWAMHALASSPEAMARWHEEVDRVLPRGTHVPDRLRLEDFPYTSAIANETMRLYPAVYNVVRVSTTDTVVAGREIRKGDTALISIYGIHRNPEYWDDPETFRPERFLNGGANRDAFLPFASGGHLCIGSHFAMMEIVTVLALIARHYNIRRSDPAPPGVVARITLAPLRPLLLELEPRNER